MSIKKIYTILDTKAGAYLPPFYLRSNGEALRAFIDEVLNRDSQLGKHPEDYVLFEVGTFDEVRGTIDLLEPYNALARGTDFLTTN